MSEEKEGEIKMRDTKDTFINKLQQASTELDSLRSSFSKDMEDLSKIQSILNLDGLTKMDTMIRSFEDQLAESERRREEAVEGARRYGMELEKEKDRLVKLWDAYKNQEESLSIQEKQVTDLEEKLRSSEQVRMQFEQDATARIRTLTLKLEEQNKNIEQVDDLKQQVMRFDTIRTQLEENVDRMRTDLIMKDEVIRSLEEQVKEASKFQQFAEFKTKFEEVSTEFEKEKERLTKLFHLYEETEAENKTIKQELHEWQSWFNANEELFTKLFSSVENLKHHNINMVTTTADEDIEIPPSLDNRQEPIEKPKRKLRFRK
jgi:chromosome segregation ATPase